MSNVFRIVKSDYKTDASTKIKGIQDSRMKQ